MIKTRAINKSEGRSERAWSWIVFDAFHSFLVEVQTKLTTYVWSMHNDNLEIKIAGSSCRPQLT